MITQYDNTIYVEDLVAELEIIEDKDSPTDRELAQADFLRPLVLELMDHIDFDYDTTLVRSTYLGTYAKELAIQIHHNEWVLEEWPFNRVDWDLAINDLLENASLIRFGGYIYYYNLYYSL